MPARAALFDRLGRESFRSTLSRAVIDARRDAIFLRRENARLARTRASPQAVIWDGRFRIGRLAGRRDDRALGLPKQRRC